MTTTIITDNKWKNFKYGYEVPEKAKKEYDYLREEDKADGWICYRKVWYHVSDFLRIQGDHPFGSEDEEGESLPCAKWDGYFPDSFFSGVFIRLSEDGEQYKIATYVSS